MSAKNRKKASRAHDFYATPMALVRASFDKLATYFPQFLPRVRRVLEPGAGTGPFCYAAAWWCSNLEYLPMGVELFPPPVSERCCNYTLRKANFLKWRPRGDIRFDFIPANPPYTYFEEFILHSREMLRTPQGLMMYLLRIGALGSKKRRKFWREVNLKEVWPIRPRPSYTPDNETDASEYAFFIMDGQRGRGCSEDVRLRWLDWKEE